MKLSSPQERNWAQLLGIILLATALSINAAVVVGHHTQEPTYEYQEFEIEEVESEQAQDGVYIDEIHTYESLSEDQRDVVDQMQQGDSIELDENVFDQTGEFVIVQDGSYTLVNVYYTGVKWGGIMFFTTILALVASGGALFGGRGAERFVGLSGLAITVLTVGVFFL